MNNSKIKDKIKQQLPDFLNGQGVSIDKPFTCLNPDHDDKEPSMSFDKKDGKHVHCFGCGAYWDIFDLIAVTKLHAQIVVDNQGKPVPNFNFADAYNLAIKMYDINAEPLTTSNKTEQNQVKNEQSGMQSKVNEINQKIIATAQSNLQNTDYFSKRGISLETAKAYGLGYSSKWVSPKAILNGATPEASPRLIIPTSNTSYIARDVRNNLTEPEQKYAKMKEGQVHIFNEQALSKNQPIFIVEGEIDALSIIETGVAQAVALGSTSNVNLFAKCVSQQQNQFKNNDYQPTFLIAMDNDSAGQLATNRLTNTLNKLHLTNYDVQIARGHKDANEALVANRKEFEDELAQTVKDPNNYLQGLLDYINNSQDVQAIPTGFDNLDKVLDGGLYEGLYGIGAISSLGKTTFALQIADYIAMNGRPVMYFALEMGRYELMTKSISRHTFMNASIDHKPELAQTTRSILKGKWQERYSKSQLANVTKSIEQYGDYYSNVVIHDGTEARPKISDIQKVVDDYVLRTGERPVVIIDYLQILKPEEPSATDKANVTTSVNAMKKLATKHHIPVITISSFNRDSYNTKVSMKSFKESGDIEYSSDVLIGLQLTGTGEKDFDVDHAKAQECREIQAVILKNRNGQTGDTLDFAYYPMFNFYLDPEASPKGSSEAPKTTIDTATLKVNAGDMLPIMDGWEVTSAKNGEYLYRNTETSEIIDEKQYKTLFKR